MSDEYHSGLIRDLAPFALRIPIDLKERIKRAAAENNRSISAEIVFALETQYPKPSPVSELQRKLDRIIEQIASAEDDEHRSDVADQLEHLRRRLSGAVEESAKAKYEEHLELLRQRREAAKDPDSEIPF
jgi:hypothetical protein